MELVATTSSILFGFLFAGFWWALDRELEFKPKARHFKFGYLLLLISMATVAVFGILVPLREASQQNTLISTAYPGIVITIVGVFGYMLTELGHYSVFQRPKYTTRSEQVFFWLTIAAMASLAVWWFR